MKKVVLPLLLIAVLGGLGMYRFGFIKERGSGDLMVSGNIEVTDAQLGFKIPGRLLERVVDEGDAVAADQLLARLDPADQALQVTQAEANEQFAKAALAELEAGTREQDLRAAADAVEQAKARLTELETGSRPQEITSAEADVAMFRAEAERSAKDAGRFERLLARKAVTQQQYDNMATAARMAAERLASAEERLKLVKEGPRVEQIDQARAKLPSAGEAVKLAKQQLVYTELKASFGGTVLSKAAEPGEYLLPGAAVVTVGDLDKPWLRAYVSETDLGKVRLGQEAEVTCDTYPGRVFKGTVSFIGSDAEFTPKTVQTFEERVKLVYRLKITLENPEHVLKPGMPADARIRLGS